MNIESRMGLRVRSRYEDVVAWIQSDPPGVPYPKNRKELQALRAAHCRSFDRGDAHRRGRLLSRPRGGQEVEGREDGRDRTERTELMDRQDRLDQRRLMIR